MRACLRLLSQFSGLWLLSLSFIASPSYARTVTMVFGPDMRPYIMRVDGQYTGLEVEIVRAALKSQGHTLRVKQYPYNKWRKAIRKPWVDGLAAVLPSQFPKQRLYYSEPYIRFKNVAITRHKEHFNLCSVQDLKGLSLVTSPNAYLSLGDEFESLYKPQFQTAQMNFYTELPSSRNQVQQFLKGQYQAIAIDMYAFLWTRAELQAEHFPYADQPLDYHWIFPPNTPYVAAFKQEAIRNAFNLGLQQIENDGTLKDIYNQFLDCSDMVVPGVDANCQISPTRDDRCPVPRDVDNTLFYSIVPPNVSISRFETGRPQSILERLYLI